jgi:pimeloyl-ACP methyl ester carboxylesterase
MPALQALEAAAMTALRLHGVRRRFCPTRHGVVHVFDGAGLGEFGRVVCVHGLISSAASYARTLLRLRPHFERVIALDLPGHGKSPPPRRRLSPTTLSESVEEVLLEETERPALLVGNSLGGGLALRFAMSHPERVRGLVLTSPAGAALTDPEQDSLLATFHMSSLRDGRRFFERLYHRPPPLSTLFAWDLLRIIGRPHLRELIHALREADAFASAELAQLRTPTLLLWGHSDDLMPDSAYQYFRSHLPAAARIERMPEVGHSPHVESPKRFAEHIVRFARELDWRSSS